MLQVRGYNKIGLRTFEGVELALKSVNFDIKFNNLLSETTVTQVYQNDESYPLEAVYTFPLPANAVLMNISIHRESGSLHGVVMAPASADDSYAEAILDRNRAIMLEQPAQGVYTMKIANLLPGEEITVRFSYAVLHQWQGDMLRYMLPTTFAPRHGFTQDAGLEKLQEPEVSMFAPNLFSLRATVSGILSGAVIFCPTHKIKAEMFSDKAVITLADETALMDRDFVLIFSNKAASRDTVTAGIDSNGGHVLLASFFPNLPTPRMSSPRDITLLLDCSGSMAGTPIEQAKKAVREVLKRLDPEDYFNIVLFGNDFRFLFDEQVRATKANIKEAKRAVRSVSANMGGTEMLGAIIGATAMKHPDIPSDFLIITDGQVWNVESMLRFAETSGHRFFTVGVSTAAAEPVLRELSRRTGGALEMVSPGENMAEYIVRHFRRIYQPRAVRTTVRWPGEPQAVIPDTIEQVFNQDTIHVFALYSSVPKGCICLETEFENGARLLQKIEIPDDENSFLVPENVISRMAIMKQIESIQDEAEAVRIAVQYQLLMPFTKYLVVEKLEDDNKPRGLPRLCKVPSLLPVGWGGTKCPASYPGTGNIAGKSHTNTTHSKKNENSEHLGISIEELKSTGLLAMFHMLATSPERIICCWGSEIWKASAKGEHSLEILDCVSLNRLPRHVMLELIDLAIELKISITDRFFHATFLYVLLKSKPGKFFGTKGSMIIANTFKALSPPAQLVEKMRCLFADITVDDWGV